MIYRDMATVNGVEIFYRDTRAEGFPILCLHGRWGRGETWVDFMRRYGERYRVIAPDQRGHGLSGKPKASYTTEEMALDMLELLRYLKIDSAVVVGHSMGGGIAGYLAARHPEFVKGLAILDKSASGPDKENVLAPDEISTIDPVSEGWPMPFQSLAEAQEYLRKETESELSYQYFMNSLVETVEGYSMMYSSQAIAANIANYKSWFDLLPKIVCPTLLIRSSSHEAVPDEDFEKMKEMLLHCSAHEVSTPDHNVHLGSKEEFYRYFEDFLRELKLLSS